MKRIKILLLVSLILSCTKQNDQQKILNTVIEYISSENIPFRKMHYHNDSTLVDNQGKMILIHPEMNEFHFESISVQLKKFRKNGNYSIEKQASLQAKKTTRNGVEVRPYHILDDKRMNDILFEQQAHAVVSFAPFIYNNDNSEAILFVNYACGGLCGGIYQYTLMKNGIEWEVSDVESITIY